MVWRGYYYNNFLPTSRPPDIHRAVLGPTNDHLRWNKSGARGLPEGPVRQWLRGGALVKPAPPPGAFVDIVLCMDAKVKDNDVVI